MYDFVFSVSYLLFTVCFLQNYLHANMVEIQKSTCGEKTEGCSYMLHMHTNPPILQFLV